MRVPGAVQSHSDIRIGQCHELRRPLQKLSRTLVKKHPAYQGHITDISDDLALSLWNKHAGFTQLVHKFQPDQGSARNYFFRMLRNELTDRYHKRHQHELKQRIHIGQEQAEENHEPTIDALDQLLGILGAQEARHKQAAGGYSEPELQTEKNLSLQRVALMPTHLQNPLYLRYLNPDELQLRECAAQLSISLATFKRHHQAALAYLRGQMGLQELETFASVKEDKPADTS